MAQIFSLEFDNHIVPIYLYKEHRSSVRYSITKKGLHIRIPKLVPGISPNREIEKASIWIKKIISQKPEIGRRFQILNFPDNFEIKTTFKKYFVSIYKSTRKSIGGKISGNEIKLILPNSKAKELNHRGIPAVLSKLIGSDQIEWISKSVSDINQKYFRKKIGKVSLKYNKSNWGSCSTNLNINLSTRLLFAPEEVINYVIIHELAHLEVMNHSPNFWNIIKNIMPDYKTKEKWLKVNGGNCDFILI